VAIVAIVLALVLGGGDDDPSAASQHSDETVEATVDAAEEQASRQAEEEAVREAEEEASRQAEEEARREAEEEASRRAEEEAQRQAEEEARAAAEAERLDPDSYEEISDRDWALVERDPDAHAGDRYVLYGYVTQFDSNTGAESFRVNTSGQPKSDWYDYEINTLVVASDAEIVEDVVTDDLVTMHVEVLGAYSYTTTLGGEMTVPLVQVNIISVDGSV
jgi:hypothetical protein